MVEAEKIIIRPIISEKSYSQIDNWRYTFEVHRDAHKTMIAQAIHQLFNVTVVGVATANIPSEAQAPGGHQRSHRGLEEGRRATRARRQDRILRGQVMGIKRFKPTSPGRRFMTVDTFEDITRSEPERSLVAPLKKNGGRNSYGRITTRHKGGGHKRRYRIIDFRRDKDGVPAKVAHIEYDPNRSARIALLHYVDGEKRYILAPQGLKVGDTVESGPSADIKPGNALPLENIPSGTTVHNIELAARVAAGSWCAAPARAPSCRPRRRGTAWCACPPANSAASGSPAAPPSARSVTPTTRTSPAARPAAPAGAVFARRCAARP